MENQKVEGGKYYTPTIEEFHTNFEYQCSNSKEPDTWWDEEFHLNDSHIDLIKYVKIQDTTDTTYKIRVKWLDQSDIESFGFIHKQYAGDGEHVLNFEYGEWYLNFWHNSSNPLVEIGRDGYDIGFFGSCKNISELKRILKQIEYKWI